MNKQIETICISAAATLRRTIEAINRAAKTGAPPGIAVVTAKNGKVLGVITDGDIRRFMLKGVSLHTPAGKLMTNAPIAVPEGLSPKQITESLKVQTAAKGRMQTNRIDRIVVVDGQGRLKNVLTYYDLWRDQDVTAKSIAVIGMGYVGATLATVMADAGFNVIGVDSDKKIIRGLTAFKPTFYERGMAAMLRQTIGRNLTLSNLEDFPGADVYILCVGTPLDKDGKPSFSTLERASRFVGGRLKKGDLVVVRSTVSVGATRRVVAPALGWASGLVAGKEFYLAMAPERTIEGKALDELRTLPQVVGGINEASVELAAKLFGALTKTIVKVQSLEAAEMVKLLNNSYRDLTFAFANEAALLCKRLGLDSIGLIRAANEGYQRSLIPLPSPGVGGVCLKKDPRIYAQTGREAGFPLKLSGLGRDINETIPRLIAEEIFRFLKNRRRPLSHAKILLLGFAFKGEPQTSDTRDSCALDLLSLLRARGAEIFGYDPVVPAREIAGLKVQSASLKSGFLGADVAVIMNNHLSFRDMDINKLLVSMRRPALFYDGWHIFTRDEIERVPGITYGGLR